MSTPKKKSTFKGSTHANSGPKILPIRNLGPTNLGGVIFGCTEKTINECLSKQIFGLPGQHFVYVKHICPGLPLFLFNYSNRQLHGIFEAASPGQLNINPYGWTKDGSNKTSYPAQVQIRVQKNCYPLLETQFSPIIKGNYYTPSHFRFELDHVQVSKLMALFSTQVVTTPPSTIPRAVETWHIVKYQHPSEPKTNEVSEIDLAETNGGPTSSDVSNCHVALTGPSLCFDDIYQLVEADVDANGKNEIDLNHEKLDNMVENFESLGCYLISPEKELGNVNKDDAFEEGKTGPEENNKGSLALPSDLMSIIAELRELKTFKEEAIQKEHRALETQQILLSEIHQLKARCAKLEALSHGITETSIEQDLDPHGSIFLAGGHDGKSWLASFDSYSPQKDIIKTLRPMSSVRSYASLAKLNGEIYAIGGGIGGMWYNIVESYNPGRNDWTSLPCLKEQKGGVASATLNEKIYAMGGGNGIHCFSNVEMLDLDVGRWITSRSMIQKRFDLATVEHNGAIYAVGGFDGNEYLSSAERFDPREHSWTRLKSMSLKRACHSLVMLNEKLYAIGGYDGSKMVPFVEVFDPRLGTWMSEAPMNYSRGYSATVSLSGSIYAVGGMGTHENILDKIERYQEGVGWQITKLKGVGKRCFAPAIVL